MYAKYLATARMTAQNQTNAGILYLLPGYAIRVLYLIPLLFLWRVLMGQGVDADGMTLAQFLTYTYMSNLLGDLLSVKTPLSDWLYDGEALSYFQRPLSIYGHVVAQSLGSIAPFLLFFTLPMAVLSPLFGVSLLPASLWAIPSLILCVSLGFAIDFLFACLLIRMMNARWLVTNIRNSLVWLFSGSFLPMAILPFNMGAVLKYLPLASMGGAPLGIYTGLSEPVSTLLIQVFWNLVLWPLVILAFNKSTERMVSHGG